MENAYQAPESDLTPTHPTTSDAIYSGPKSRPVGNCIDWLMSGFEIFKAYPGQWILTLIVGFVLMIVIQIIPVIGSIVTTLTTYVWLGGLMLGCHAIRKGEKFDVSYLFAGFKNRLGALLGLSLLYFITALIIFGVVLGSLYLEMITGDNINPDQFLSAGFWLRMAIGMLLFIPIAMALWFAPALIVLQNMSVLDAVKASFVGCLKNILPLFLLGIIMIVLFIIGSIPLLLGLLVLMPTFYGTIYTSYEDIFLTKHTDKA